MKVIIILLIFLLNRISDGYLLHNAKHICIKKIHHGMSLQISKFITHYYHPLITGMESLNYKIIYQFIVLKFAGIGICTYYRSICAAPNTRTLKGRYSRNSIYGYAPAPLLSGRYNPGGHRYPSNSARFRDYRRIPDSY